jgi:hypothetical protein
MAGDPRTGFIEALCTVNPAERAKNHLIVIAFL